MDEPQNEFPGPISSTRRLESRLSNSRLGRPSLAAAGACRDNHGQPRQARGRQNLPAPSAFEVCESPAGPPPLAGSAAAAVNSPVVNPLVDPSMRSEPLNLLAISRLGRAAASPLAVHGR